MPEFYTLLSYARLAVADLKATARWYGEALAFHPVAELKSGNGAVEMVHLRRATHQDLLLVPRNGGRPAGAPGTSSRPEITLGFTVEEDVDALAERARIAGASIVEGPVDRPWNAREVVLRDPEGHTLAFTRVKTRRTFSDVIEHLIGPESNQQ